MTVLTEALRIDHPSPLIYCRDEWGDLSLAEN